MDDDLAPPPADAPDQTPPPEGGAVPGSAAAVPDSAAAAPADQEADAAAPASVGGAAGSPAPAPGPAPSDPAPAAPSAQPAPAPSAAGHPPASDAGPAVAPDPASAVAPDAGWAVAPTYATTAKPRRSRGAIVAICLLAVALVLALGGGAWVALQWVQAQERISDQQEKIEQQRELIEKKEEFGAAMTGLMGTTAKFDGVLTATIVPWDDYRTLADRAWSHRWDAAKLTADTEQAELAADQLELVWSTAQQEASTNTTGTTYESVIDRLGAGFVRSVLDEKLCSNGDDGILGCVFEGDPYLVHFDALANALPYMNDELRTGIAYHEFAHVLQFTNQAATDATLPAFGGDVEVMADCFALTFLDGWKLDHRIWVSSYEYWDVNIGYGQTCSEPQRQTVRDWYAQLGVQQPGPAS